MEIVFHVGAAMKGGPFEFQSGTIWGTRNIVDACERHGVRPAGVRQFHERAGPCRTLPGASGERNFPYEPSRSSAASTPRPSSKPERWCSKPRPPSASRPWSCARGRSTDPAPKTSRHRGTINLAGRWLVVGSGEHYVPLVYVDNVVDALLRGGRRRCAERLHLPVGGSAGDAAEGVCGLRAPLRAAGARFVCARLVSEAAPGSAWSCWESS